jgi:ectoine hydroxylase-related dioxygenase (phytanoyl-CoA dioxygenase family)
VGGLIYRESFLSPGEAMSTQSFVSAHPLVRQLTGLKSRAYQRYRERRFPASVYNVLYYVRNREPAKHYHLAQAQLAPQGPIEEKVIRELKEDGISLVHVEDLLQAAALKQAQAWAERLVVTPANQERIKLVEGGARPQAKSGKYFLVRLLGDEPVLDFDDVVVGMSISSPILRIVSGYLGMFGRVAALELWYNIATTGPAVFSQRWHRDPEDKRLVKTFLYLRDVDETAGPFCFVRGTHNDGPLKHVRPSSARMYPEDGFVEKTFPPDLIRLCTGKAGTLIFADTTGFHKGGQPKKDPRLLFNAVYTTNASIPLVLNARQYRVTGSPSSPLDEVASYAIGHLASVK